MAFDAAPKMSMGSKTGFKRKPADKPIKVGYPKPAKLGIDKSHLPILKAAVKMARDEIEAEGRKPDMEAVKTFLQNRLRPEDWKRLNDMLMGQDPDQGEYVEDDDLESETSEREQREETGLATMSNAKDEPLTFW
jgi:hypothetical protein